MSFTTEQIGEIRTAYRDAADPKKQIGILADLYCTTKQEICQALEIEAPLKKKARSYDQAVKKRCREGGAAGGHVVQGCSREIRCTLWQCVGVGPGGAKEAGGVRCRT